MKVELTESKANKPPMGLDPSSPGVAILNAFLRWLQRLLTVPTEGPHQRGDLLWQQPHKEM